MRSAIGVVGTALSLVLMSGTGCGGPVPAHTRLGSVTLTATGPSTSRGVVTVPARAGAPSARLAVAVHWADRRPRVDRPALFVGPGGPGLPETGTVLHARALLSPRLLAHYNVVGIDVRGAGRSVPRIDCGGRSAAEQALFSPVWDDSPRAVAEVRSAAARFARSCGRLSGAVLASLTLQHNVLDHEAVRAALGLGRVDVLGLSQSGTAALVWAAMSPTHVGRVVADGSPDPAQTAAEVSLDQAQGMQRQLQRFEKWCDAKSCTGSDSAGSALGRLLSEADRPGGPTSGMLLTALVQGLYSDQAFERLGAALRKAAGGDDREMAAFASYSMGGEHDVESFYGYACNAPGARLPPPRRRAEVQALRSAAPDLWRFFARDYVCDSWPVTAEAPLRWDPGQLHRPTLLIGSRQDPVTAYAGVRALHASMPRSTLLTTTLARHTSYPSSSCVRDQVDDFLLAGRAADHVC